MRRLVVASAILASLMIMPLGAVAASPTQPTVVTTDSARATSALEYLGLAEKANGSIDGKIGETADYVIGAAAAGYDPSTIAGCNGGSTALSFLATASDGATGDAGQTAKAILAVVAAGRDPASFSGRDLTARLSALFSSTSGAYGTGDTFAQSLAILAVAASGGSVPKAATDYLAGLQASDGGWSYGTTQAAAGDGDTNSTAIALMGLDAAGISSKDTAGLAFLATQQLADGGFPFQNNSTWGPPASDADSDALVLQAIVATGGDPEASAWTQGSNTVLTHLRSAQGADGGFAYPFSPESALTTSQVPAALMRVPYAAPVHFTAGLRVPTECVAPPATATPHRTATPKPTVRRTPKPTARPTGTPAITEAPAITVAPTVAITAQPTPSATRPSATQTQVEAVAGETASPGGTSGSDSAPSTPILLYGAVAAFGLVAVLLAGWLYIERPWVR